MLIKLTLLKTRQEMYMRAMDVLLIEKNPSNQLGTIVRTPMFTQNGQLCYEVLEQPSEIALLVEHALRGKTKDGGLTQ